MAAEMIAKKHRAERCVAPRSAEDTELMGRVVRAKATQNCAVGEFARQWNTLIGMGPVFIVEDSSKRPSGAGLFWGAALADQLTDLWRGRNCLGQIWMDLVAECRDETCPFGKAA
jgi:predicted NAD-dependent protein-ADP-ribosyltransferase YbiA (DUF1768 family)